MGDLSLGAERPRAGGWVSHLHLPSSAVCPIFPFYNVVPSRSSRSGTRSPLRLDPWEASCYTRRSTPSGKKPSAGFSETSPSCLSELPFLVKTPSTPLHAWLSRQRGRRRDRCTLLWPKHFFDLARLSWAQ